MDNTDAIVFPDIELDEKLESILYHAYFTQ